MNIDRYEPVFPIFFVDHVVFRPGISWAVASDVFCEPSCGYQVTAHVLLRQVGDACNKTEVALTTLRENVSHNFIEYVPNSRPNTFTIHTRELSIPANVLGHLSLYPHTPLIFLTTWIRPPLHIFLYFQNRPVIFLHRQLAMGRPTSCPGHHSGVAWVNCSCPLLVNVRTRATSLHKYTNA